MPVENPRPEDIVAVSPIMVELDDGGMEVDLEPEEEGVDLSDHHVNLAEHFSE